MFEALWISKTGLDAQQQQVNVISNNLANVNTVGFKKSRPVFEDLLYQTQYEAGSATSEDTELNSGLTLGTGVRLVATQKEFTEGNVTHTDNPLDLTINGRGFFQISMPDGSTAYTRDGQFQMNEKGQLVTAKGYVVQPNITVPEQARSISIGRDGRVTAVTPGSEGVTELGTIQVADFVNVAGLTPLGENLFKQSGSSGAPMVQNPGQAGSGVLLQGSVETSNVNVVEELVNLIETQRAYEMNSKAIATEDQMLQYMDQTI